MLNIEYCNIEYYQYWILTISNIDDTEYSDIRKSKRD